MRQNGAADDGQIGIGTNEIVRELSDKVEQLAEACTVDLHGRMNRVKHDAVLIIVNVRRILHVPRGLINGDRDNAVVLACRMVDTACVTGILRAQLALGIACRRQIACRCNCLGVLLGLGQVNGDVQLTVCGISLPLHITRDAVAADVVCILAEFIVPVGCLDRVLCVQCTELCDDLTRRRGQAAHQAGIEQITVDDGIILHHTACMCVVHQLVQNCGQVDRCIVQHRLLVAVQLQCFEQCIDCPNMVFGCDQAGILGISHQLGHCGINHVRVPPSQSAYPCGCLLCQSQAVLMMVFRSSYSGFQPSTVLAFSLDAISCAGSPARRASSLAGMG